MPSSAARTNLTSQDVRISNYKLGEGTFRVCLEGTYIGGNRNQQVAACKRFKPQFRDMEDEFFDQDFKIADVTIRCAEEWNKFCPYGKELLISKGDIQYSNSGIPYWVEPVIRYYTKFTSNTGWIANTSSWKVRCMEAFSHYSYHYYNGSKLICDLQGRHRGDRNKQRFELGDPAICSKKRIYGPTDLGEKGIDSFFANHVCNEFCNSNWKRPRSPSMWFPRSSGTSMLSSRLSNKLSLNNGSTFRFGKMDTLEPIPSTYNNYYDSDSDDSW